MKEDIRYEKEKMAPDLMQFMVILGKLIFEKIANSASRSVMSEGVIE